MALSLPPKNNLYRAMNKIRYCHIVLFTLCLTLALSVCCQQPQAPTLLAQATELIAAYPDSVKAYEALLTRCIRQAEDSEDWQTCARARLLLSQQVQWTREDEALQLARDALQAHQRAMSQATARDADSAAVQRIDIQLSMAAYLQQTDSLAHARSLLITVLSEARRLHLRERQNAALGQLANLSLVQGQPHQALALARQMQLDTVSTREQEARFILATCLLQADSVEAAREVYEQLVDVRSPRARYVALRRLAEIAMLTRDYALAPQLVDTAFASAEDVFFHALQQKDDYYHAVLQQERTAERLRYRGQLTMWMLVAVAMVAVLVIVFIVSLNRHRHTIHQQRLLAEQRERELVEQKLRHEAQQRQMEQREREREKQEQERERHAARQRLEQQDTMIRLLQRFIIEKSEVIQRLHAVGDQRIRLSKRDWQEIEQTLDSITGGFVSRLRAQHPQFHEEDIQLCMLTRMKLTNQSIAAVYFITVSAVKHRKLKLKKDGFGQADPQRPLDAVLATI